MRATLVVVEDLAAIAKGYSKPKHKVEEVLGGLVWKGTIMLEKPPPTKNGEQTATETKKVKVVADNVGEVVEVAGILECPRCQ